MVLSEIYKLIGRLLGEDKPPDELGDPIDFESGVFLDCGISWVHVSDNSLHTFFIVIIHNFHKNI